MAVETKIDPATGKTLFHKNCFNPKCGAEFWGSRKAKFCKKESCKQWGRDRVKAVHASRKKHLEIRNDDVEKARIKCASHSIARAALKYKLRWGECETAGCGKTEGLEVHHCNTNWLDNRPENLKCLCLSCHAKTHSEMKKAEGATPTTLEA